ncbi:hypothetical protein EDD11_000222 [Mortierella claussenii]|nr:hypothetical protein EDD11_000222 [Mortierella claussenii]
MALFLTLCLSPTSAQPLDPAATVTLSFTVGINDPVSKPSTTSEVHANSCFQISSLATSFSSSLDQSVFAIYQDAHCESYLYSVEAYLTNLHGAQSMVWVGVDQTNLHVLGETFTDPVFTVDQAKEDRRTRLIQILAISLGSAFILIGLGLSFCYMDNRRNLRRGGYVPEPSSPTGHRTMAEVSGPGRSIYQYSSHYRSSSSASSSISSLPPYGGGENYVKAVSAGYDIVTPPQEARIASYPIEKKTLGPSRYELSTTRPRSYSNLTNQVGTGAGLDPGSVQQGRNAGFGLGYDIEMNKRDSRRGLDLVLQDAMVTPPHSPRLRPSSVISDDNGQIIGRGGVLIDSHDIYMPA